MSGLTEASFPIPAERQRDVLVDGGHLKKRTERLFAVDVAAGGATTLGSQRLHEEGLNDWITIRGEGANTERAKHYILSQCSPVAVKECETDQQSVEQLLSETNRFRDSIEREFSTAIFPGSSSTTLTVQGTSESAIRQTVERIQTVMAPPDLPQPQPSYSSSSSTTSSLTISRPPATTAGYFTSVPSTLPVTSLASTYSDSAQQRQRVSPHQFPGVPTPDHSTPSLSARALPASSANNREQILQMISCEIEEQTNRDVVPRGVDSSHREQRITYFLNLNFPRERIEAVVDSMGPWADTNDILERLNILCIPAPRPVPPSLSVPRNYPTEPLINSTDSLRPVVIDGSNVAMRHGNGRVFSCRGIQIVVDWFRQRGHEEITVFVPLWRKERPRGEYPITNQEILNQLERDETLKFTPSRRFGNKKIVCYDDRWIVSLAAETNGVIVSNDNFRDLAEENEKWRRTIEQRLIMFQFVKDFFMPAEDPLGKHGPTLDQLLKLEPTKSSSKARVPPDHTGPTVCPYGERCTFGRKCRFAHPERERENRLDPAHLASRSPNTSPTPTDKRLTSTDDVVQTDSVNGHPATDRSSPPSGQVLSSSHVSPQKPRTCPAPHSSDVGYNSHTTLPHTYSQPHPTPYSTQHLPSDTQQHYSHSQPHQLAPHYLGIPGTHGNSISPPPHSSGLQTTPLHSTASTPSGGIPNFSSRPFNMSALSVQHPRNVTDQRLSNGTIANGGEDYHASVGPSPRASLVPSQRPPHPPVEPHSGLIPRGEYITSYQPPPPHRPQHDQVYNHPYGHYRHPAPPAPYHPANTYQPSNHHYSGEQLTSSSHHSPARNSQHPADYPTPHGGTHLPQQSTAPYQNIPPPTENGQYYPDHSTAALRNHYHPHQQRGGVELSQAPTTAAHGPGHRAASMYGDMGLRLHHQQQQQQEKLAMVDKFHCSQSSPDLYREARPNQQPLGHHPHHQQHQQQQHHKPSIASGGINWPLFKQAQTRLPDQEERIMKTMLQHPHLDLEQLVELIQKQSW